jgi:protein-S-isoprenylcysteine O-methyltransferase Ste14
MNGGNMPNIPLNGLGAFAAIASVYLVIIVGLLFFAIITAVVAAKKGRNALGWFFIGLFTGLFGLAIALAILPKRYYVQSGEDDF